MGIDLNKYNRSKYFTAAELTAPLDLTTSAVEEQIIGRDGEEEEKIVLLFREDKRMLPLNKTRRVQMEDLFGGDTDKWARRRIRIRRVRSTYGSSLWSIVIEAVPTPQKTRPAESEPEPELPADIEDETPAPESEDWEVADAE